VFGIILQPLNSVEKPWRHTG